MRPKARGPAQHGGPAGLLEERDPAGVILYVIDGPFELPPLQRNTVDVYIRIL